MVTHDPLAASYCKRIVFIKDGELIDEIIQKRQPKRVLRFNHGETG